MMVPPSSQCCLLLKGESCPIAIIWVHTLKQRITRWIYKVCVCSVNVIAKPWVRGIIADNRPDPEGEAEVV